MILREKVTTPQGELHIMQPERDDLSAILGIFDDVVAWLVAQGSVKQWGSEHNPNDNRPHNVSCITGPNESDS